MVCYQVTVRFIFCQRRPALVSTHIKKQKAKAFLVMPGLPFGHGPKYSILEERRNYRANPKTRLVLGLALEKAVKARFFFINSG
jgi:hypothetical protein